MRKNKKRRDKGFSLVELLAVIVIMGILATTITVSTLSYMKKSRIELTRVNIRQVTDQVIAFKLVNGSFPDELGELVPDFIQDQTSIVDGWGNEFFFAAPGENAEVDLISGGEDGDLNSTEDNINSWELGKKAEN